MQPTWQADDVDGALTTAERDRLPASVFAFPEQRKEPLTSASHVRDAVARFNQVAGVDASDRDLAWANIQAAAEHYGVTLREDSWHELG
ncbi:MAG: hypothetical protein E6Q90_12160 [Actinobacteria bacterium]|nr:MAG: hypothetical protein E6Q90_12160 [Actinomycetota bacterium]